MVTASTGTITMDYSYSPSSTPNRLDSTFVGTTVTNYTFDGSGRVKTYGAKTLTYDYRGLTVKYNDGADHTYPIDTDGERVKKVSGGVTTYYIRGSVGSVLEEYDGTQPLTTTYLYRK